MEIKLEIKNFKELLQKLSKKTDVKKIMQKWSKNLCENAKSLCPVDTGKLRDSIKYETTEDKIYVYTDVYYAPYVEFGTGRRGDGSYPVKVGFNYGKVNGQVAQPFMYPALMSAKDEITNDFIANLRGG